MGDSRTPAGPTVVACSLCGAGMRELPGTVSEAPVLACPHCGSNEPLPNDVEERVAFMRRLGSSRRWADDPLRGGLVNMLGYYEGPWLATSLSGMGVVALSVAGALFLGRGNPLALLHQDIPGMSPEALLDLRWSTAFNLVLGPTVLAVSALYAVVAVYRGRWILRREIGPWVMASTPTGAAECCRRCGAELPHVDTALRDCAYCKAANVVSTSGVVRAYVAAARAAATIRPEEAPQKLADVEARLRSDVGRIGMGAIVLGLVLTLGLTFGLVHLS